MIVISTSGIVMLIIISVLIGVFLGSCGVLLFCNWIDKGDSTSAERPTGPSQNELPPPIQGYEGSAHQHIKNNYVNPTCDGTPSPIKESE